MAAKSNFITRPFVQNEKEGWDIVEERHRKY